MSWICLSAFMSCFFSDFQGSFLLASGLHDDAGKWLSVLMF